MRYLGRLDIDLGAPLASKVINFPEERMSNMLRKCDIVEIMMSFCLSNREMFEPYLEQYDIKFNDFYTKEQKLQTSLKPPKRKVKE